MKKIIGCLALIPLLSLLMTACCLSHKWVDATCAAPKTCTECGKTEGDMLPHTWEDATCEAPRTCSGCGATEGEALGHTWVDATCTTAKKCSVCGKKDGISNGHTFVWTTIKEPTYLSEGEQQGTCEVCGYVSSSTKTIDKLPIEYHWNQPIQFTDQLSIGFYKDSENYWVEIQSTTLPQYDLILLLTNTTTDWGFDLRWNLEWYYENVFGSYDRSWTSNGVYYYSIDGTDGNWQPCEYVFYFYTNEETPGVIGLKTNGWQDSMFSHVSD